MDYEFWFCRLRRNITGRRAYICKQKESARGATTLTPFLHEPDVRTNEREGLSRMKRRRLALCSRQG